MKIKNYDIYFHNALDESSKNPEAQITETSPINFRKQSVEICIPACLTTSTVGELSDSEGNEYFRYRCDKNNLDLGVYIYEDYNERRIRQRYESHLLKVSPSEMTQRLELNAELQEMPVVLPSHTDLDLFRHISEVENTFRALSLVRLQHVNIIFDFSCPNCNSNRWLKAVIEIINSAKVVS